MGNKPSAAQAHIETRTATETRTTENCDTPVGCCIQFQKVSSRVRSSCCMKRVDVRTENVTGSSVSVNITT